MLAAHALAIDASSLHVCTDEWLPTASTLCPLSLSCKKSVGGKFQLCLMQNSNGPLSENFVTIGGCFEHYTYHVTALGWLKKSEKKKKEEKKMNIYDFRLFQVCHFK